MVMTAEPNEIPPLGGASFCIIEMAMVDLEVVGTIAARDDANRVTFQEGDGNRSRNMATEITDGGNVDAVGDEESGDGISHDLLGGLHRDRTDAGDLTRLAWAH